MLEAQCKVKWGTVCEIFRELTRTETSIEIDSDGKIEHDNSDKNSKEVIERRNTIAFHMASCDKQNCSTSLS